MHDTMVPGKLAYSTGVRIFLLSASLLALLVAASAAAAWIIGERSAREAVATVLESGIAAQQALSQQQLAALQRTAERIGADLVARVAAPAQADAASTAAGALPAAQLTELLAAQQVRSGFDLGLVLDPGAVLVAHSGEPGALGDSLASDPLVAPALSAVTPMSGFWTYDDRLHLAAVVPLTNGAATVGYLLLARRVDDALATVVSDITAVEAAFWVAGARGPALVASSLDDARAQSLVQRFRDTPELVDALQLGQALERMPLQLEGEPWVVRLAPLAGGAGGASGVAMALTPTAAAVSGYRRVLAAVLASGAVALLLALLLSAWLSRRLLQPVGQLADAAARAATGDYQPPAAVTGGPAVDRLGGALAALLADLRERRALEEYVASVSRLLPEAVDGGDDAFAAPAAVAGGDAPVHADAVLLGMELPGMPGDPEGAAAGAADTARRLHALARACAGELVTGDGERWTLVFAGPQRLEHALQAARAALSGFGSEALRPALALAEGTVERATLVVDEQRRPLLLGAAGRQLLRLLCESAPARALIARPLGDRIRERFGTEALEVAAGTLGGRRYYALRAGGLPSLDEPPSAVVLDGTGSTRRPHAAAPRRWRPGARVDGRYEILAVLGDRGLGTVYKARDSERDDLVALRVLRADDDAPSAVAGLQEQVRLLRRIAHPNVLRTFDTGTIEGCTYVTTEFVRGISLRELLAQSGRLPYRAALRVARQLCAGLAAGHAIGALHRDVRPANLVLSAAGNVRLMDFGIAPALRRAERAPSEPSQEVTFVGVPFYCAPEQLAGDLVDERADVYACGAVLSEIFCGGLPYAGDSAMDLYLAQLRQEPLRPSLLWPEIPTTLERIILRCIARRREDRFPDAGKLAEALAGLPA